MALSGYWKTDLFQLQVVTAGYVQTFLEIDYRIGNRLIQRVINLMSIDEGSRSRDQNQSIKRLTWITVRQAQYLEQYPFYRD